MFYFAWIPEWGTDFDPLAHAVQDLEIYGVEVTEEEGVAPGFTLQVRNPGMVGILAGSNRYALLSERTTDDAQPVLLARGRISGMPSKVGDRGRRNDLSGDVVALEFTCLPPDADDVLTAFADTLRTADAAYDPLYVSDGGTDDPATAIEGRPVEYYWNRKTLALSTSDIITGGRVVDVGTEALDGSVSATLTEPPAKRARLFVSASWEQRAFGTLPLGGAVMSSLVGNEGALASATGDDFAASWPTTGSSFGDGSGWTLIDSSLRQYGTEDFPLSQHYGGIGGGTTVHATMRAALFRIDGFTARFEYRQQREERLELLVESGIQDVLGDDRVQQIEEISLRDVSVDADSEQWEPFHNYMLGDTRLYNGKTVRCLIPHTSAAFFAMYQVTEYPNGGITKAPQWEIVPGLSPLGDLRRPAYFSTDRGRRSVEHSIERARKYLLQKARCIEVSFDCAWSVARDLTVDDSVRLEWTKLPGGEAIGKVISLSLRADGDGNRIATVKIGVCVGTGGATVDPGSDPSEYFDDNYVGDPDYSMNVSTTDRQTASGVVYGWPDIQPRQPVNPFRLTSTAYSIRDISAENLAISQWFACGAAMVGFSDSIEVDDGLEAVLARRKSRVSVTMRDLSQSDIDRLSYIVVCQPISCPMGINLASEG